MEGRTVRLRPIGRPYGSFTARRKAVRFILRTVSRTYGQFGALFARQPRRHLRRDFLCIFVFYSFISCVFLLYFSVLLKQLRRLYIGGSIFKYHQYIITAPIVIPRNFLCIFWFYSFISFTFYVLIKAITEAIHRWFHFSSTASV